MDANVIATNATRIWQLMNDGATWCFEALKRVTGEINAALGWLAREDSVEIIPDPVTREDTFKVRHFWEGGL